MDFMKSSIDKRVVYNNCLQYLNLYIDGLVAVQEEVFNALKNDFKPEDVCEPTATPKYLTVLSKFTSSSASKGNLYENVIKCYTIWKDKLEPVVRDATKKSAYAELPLRLAACFFLNGDYYKALLCLRHTIYLEPKNLVPRILALRWSVYLGEWEMLEMALAFEKLKPPKSHGEDDFVMAQLRFIIEIAKSYVEFNRDHKSRPTSAKSILEMTNLVNSDTHMTYYIFESQAFANWICAQLPKVAKFSTEDPLLDSYNCLHRAVSKSESVMKNRLPGIQKEHLPMDFKCVTSDTTDFVKACSSFAECCELRRDYVIELLHVGTIRDAAANSQLGLYCALKSGVLFRIQQFVNTNTLLRSCVVHPDFKNDLHNCLDMLRMMYSNGSSVTDVSFGYSKKRPSEVSFSDELTTEIPLPPISTPIRSPARVGQKSLATTLIESFEELRLETVSSLHELSDKCSCNFCWFCRTNYNASFEYWFSSFLYESMSESAIQCLEEQFHALRARVAPEQCAVLGKKVKPRPPSIMCETFALCVVRWLRRLEDSPWDSENLKLKSLRDSIVKSALKICGYSSVRTVCYRLSISQLERIRKLTRCYRYEWMKDTSRAGKFMDAVTQYLFPSRLCGNASDDEDSPEVVAQKIVEKNMMKEALSEYASFSNLLYRDWRFPVCTFLGEYVSCPWQAAMMWSESTMLATRQLSRFMSGKMNGFVFSQPSLFKKMVEQLPADFTLVHLALSHDGSLHLIKLHRDREPIIMPLAPKSKVETVKALMEKLIEENSRTCCLGKVTQDAKTFWAARRAVDADLKETIPRVQNILLGAAAPLLLPSISLNRSGLTLAKALVSASQSPSGAQLPLSFAKELVSLSSKLEKTEWIRVAERLCDVAGVSSQKEAVQELYLKTRAAVAKGGFLSDIAPLYTFLIICPDLTTFPWEVIPVFCDSPYVARVPSVHALLQTLRKSTQVPFEVNVHNAFYVLDPDNNLGDTRRRITDYVSKFGWEGVVGKVPTPKEVTDALSQRDVFFYMGHGSGSRYFSRRVICENTVNAVSVLMGCGSVRMTPYGWGMDGKSSVYDYTVAQCPSIVGCLWTVTDGEIDRYFMALVDLCFSSDANRTLTGTDGTDSRLRVLVEAMHRAKSRCKLPYLTGASVVSYGIPVIAME
ncbi:unnamed protein product [Haemonchus placei]|uniref:separase n=1 Tax=Haemonchus placei TaxID=6290 RepID=A0A0N4WA34_HAEPC|nr:unnamed protein product [Haemonchus placei]